MSSWKAVVASCLIGWLCAAVTAWAQSPQQPVPRFRSGVDLVAVDVSVVDRDGQPVGDLTVEDFSITVDGSPRRLVSAAFIPLGADARPSPAPAAPEAGTEPAPAFSSTNEGAVGGRLILFVVDRGNIRAGEGRRLFEAAGTFIDRLGPADRVALAVVPGGGPNVEFTADGGLVKTALQTVVGGATPLLTNYSVGLTEALAIHRQDLTTRERVVQRECRLAQDPDALKKCRMEVLAEARLAYLNWRQQASASLVALRELLARLALIGGPKTMVVLTGGMFVDAWEGSELDTIADAAARADATLYTFGLDVDRADAATAEVSPTYEADRLLVRQGLERLAGEAGGRAFSVATGGAAQFERLARELSGYYLLSFEPAPGDDDGKPHRIGVDVGRRGVEVGTRRHFLTAAGSPRPASDVLAELLRTPRPATELRMRVATSTHPGDEGLVRVVMAGDIDGSATAGPVPCGFSLTNAAGETIAAETEGWSATAEPTGGRHACRASIVLAPARYTLRLAAVDAEGRRGSVEHVFEARVRPAASVTGPGAPGPAGIAGVAAFDRQRVLGPDVVGFVLDRLPAGIADSPSPPVAAAVDAARRGALDQIEPALAGAGDAGAGTELLRGLALFARGEVDSAALGFQKALSLSPGFFGAAFYLGACRAAAGRDDAAAAVWEDAFGAETEGSFTLELLADALLRAGDGPRAADVLTEARLLWPDEPGFTRRLAVAEAMAERHPDAVATLDEYLAARPDDAAAWLLAAWLVYDARTSGHPLGTFDEDLARIARCRDRYTALGGPDTELIDRWIDAVRRR